MTTGADARREPDGDELDKMWTRFKETGDAETKNEILLQYTHLVKWVVNRLMPKYNNYSERDDLYSCGIIGLIDAIGKFDTKHGVKFETYAIPRIRGEILDYMRAQDWAPPSLRRKISAITDAYEALENEHGTAPSDQQIADALQMPVAQVQKILNQSHIFNVVNFEDALNFQGVIEDSAGVDENSPERNVLEKERREVLATAIRALPEKERLVITLYYYEGLLLKEIAEVLQVSESRVSQIHSKVLAKMSAKLRKFV